jgi:hypothetical protein
MKCCSMFPACGSSHKQLLLLSFGIQQVNSSQDTDVTVIMRQMRSAVTFIMICCVSFCLKGNRHAEAHRLTGPSTACSWKLPCRDRNYADLFTISLSWTSLSFRIWWCITCEIITSIWGNLLSPSSRYKRNLRVEEMVRMAREGILGQRARPCSINITRREIHL